MAGFHIENFGCRAARADGEAMSAALRSRGLSEFALSDADLVIVNTCSVTAEADRDARAFVRKTRRLNPHAKVVVTGCYAQRAPQELAALEGVAAVIGNSHKALAPQIAYDLLACELLADGAPQPSPLLAPASLLSESRATQVWADDAFAHSWIEEAQASPGYGPGAQTRPNLKIQEGCSNRCTFCVIPTTRGASRSLATDKVLAQVRGFVAAGGNELVLSGINLGRWGRDLPESRSLAGMVRQILEETGLPRLRLSSIEPMDWTRELIALMREFSRNSWPSDSLEPASGPRIEPRLGPRLGPRLARHAHLPLQSGSDAVLRRMHRRYRPWHYAQKVAELREAAGPELGLGADVMVGFPGETEAEFQESYDFIATQPFTYLHIFPFSPRPGTRGWELHQQTPVPSKAVQERMAALRHLAAEMSHQFRAGFVGRTLPAITLNAAASLRSQTRTPALTDNFLPVEISESLPANQLVSVRVTALGATGELLGHVTAAAYA